MEEFRRKQHFAMYSVWVLLTVGLALHGGCITNVYSPQNQDDPWVDTRVNAAGGSTADVWVDAERQDGASEAEQKSKADVKTDVEADVDASAVPGVP